MILQPKFVEKTKEMFVMAYLLINTTWYSLFILSTGMWFTVIILIKWREHYFVAVAKDLGTEWSKQKTLCSLLLWSTGNVLAYIGQ